MAAAAPGTTGEVKGERACEGETQEAGDDIANGRINDIMLIESKMSVPSHREREWGAQREPARARDWALHHGNLAGGGSMKGSPPQSCDFPRGPGQHRRLTRPQPADEGAGPFRGPARWQEWSLHVC